MRRDEFVENVLVALDTLRDRKARQGRNPRSGQSIQVPPKRVVYFKLGKELRSRLIDE